MDRPSVPQQVAQGPKPFMPGVRIDWARKEIEVDARVVLREGMLELFACSPGTREHESIVSIDAASSHVFQALGLLGLEPGKPARWDPTTQRAFPASGPRLSIRVRYEMGGQQRTEELHKWMWDAKRDRPAPPTRWVFCGSVLESGNRLASDREGTVICVVDFEAALISFAGSFSANNEDLWLRPHTEEIPPVGSPCVLLIQPVPESHREVRLGRYGRIWYEGSRTSLLWLLQHLERDLQVDCDLALEVIVQAGVIQADVSGVLRIAERAGLPIDRIVVAGHESMPAGDIDLQGLMTILRGNRIEGHDYMEHASNALQVFWNVVRAIGRTVNLVADGDQTAAIRSGDLQRAGPEQ